MCVRHRLSASHAAPQRMMQRAEQELLCPSRRVFARFDNGCVGTSTSAALCALLDVRVRAVAVWDCNQLGVYDALGTVMQPDRGCATEAAPHACQVQISQGGRTHICAMCGRRGSCAGMLGAQRPRGARAHAPRVGAPQLGLPAKANPMQSKHAPRVPRRSWARLACPRRPACAPCSPTRATRSRRPSSRCRATTLRTRWRAAPHCIRANPDLNRNPMPMLFLYSAKVFPKIFLKFARQRLAAGAAPSSCGHAASGCLQCQAARRPGSHQGGRGQRLRRGRAGGPEQGVGEPHVPAVRAAEPLARGHRQAPVHAQPDLALPGPAVAAGLLRRGADRQLCAVQARPARPLPCTRTGGSLQVTACLTERQAVHSRYLDKAHAMHKAAACIR